MWAAVCKTEMICQCWRKLLDQGLLLPLSQTFKIKTTEPGCMCVGSKVTQFGDNRAWPYWAQWAVVIIILLVTAVRLSVAGSWRWVRAATGQDMARGGAQGHFYNDTHFNIRLTCYLLAPLRVIRLYGAMKIQAHTHFHKDISDIWHSKFFSVPSYFFWKYWYI